MALLGAGLFVLVSLSALGQGDPWERSSPPCNELRVFDAVSSIPRTGLPMAKDALAFFAWRDSLDDFDVQLDIARRAWPSDKAPHIRWDSVAIFGHAYERSGDSSFYRRCAEALQPLHALLAATDERQERPLAHTALSIVHADADARSLRVFLRRLHAVNASVPFERHRSQWKGWEHVPSQFLSDGTRIAARIRALPSPAGFSRKQLVEFLLARALLSTDTALVRAAMLAASEAVYLVEIASRDEIADHGVCISARVLRSFKGDALLPFLPHDSERALQRIKLHLSTAEAPAFLRPGTTAILFAVLETMTDQKSREWVFRLQPFSNSVCGVITSLKYDVPDYEPPARSPMPAFLEVRSSGVADPRQLLGLGRSYPIDAFEKRIRELFSEIEAYP
jgi:hypothetical protein